jgi:hypothetical protein
MGVNPDGFIWSSRIGPFYRLEARSTDAFEIGIKSITVVEAYMFLEAFRVCWAAPVGAAWSSGIQRGQRTPGAA